MNEIQQEKCAWVNGYLSAALANADIDVRRVRYVQDGAEARVEVEFNANDYRTMTRKLDVTGMDEREIFKAVAAIV